MFYQISISVIAATESLKIIHNLKCCGNVTVVEIFSWAVKANLHCTDRCRPMQAITKLQFFTSPKPDNWTCQWAKTSEDQHALTGVTHWSEKKPDKVSVAIVCRLLVQCELAFSRQIKEVSCSKHYSNYIATHSNHPRHIYMDKPYSTFYSEI